MIVSPRTRLFLVRHGETVFNAQGLIAGSTDLPLTDVGREQARRLGAWMRDQAIDAAICSPQRRAAETCRLIVEGRNLPVVFAPNLAERDFGEWEGKSFQQIADAQPDGGRSIMHGPFMARFASGESDEIFEARVRRVFHESLLLRFPHRNVLVVSHAAVLMMLMVVALGLNPKNDFATFRLDNASVTRLDWYDGVPHVGFVNRVVPTGGSL